MSILQHFSLINAIINRLHIPLYCVDICSDSRKGEGWCNVTGVASGHIGSMQGMSLGRLRARCVPMTE